MTTAALPAMPAATHVVELELGGMTCASCAARITKRLDGLTGVEAQVNYATERATVSVHGDTTVDEIVAAIESIGYTASPVASGADLHVAPDADTGAEPQRDRVPQALLQRLIGSLVLGVPEIGRAHV